MEEVLVPNGMDNRQIARLLDETADLMEIDGADSFRVRSYRRAAETATQTTVELAGAGSAELLAIPGIGKSMAANLGAIAESGTFSAREELLAKYGLGILELLKLPGMGPKTVALVWDALKIATIEQLAEAIAAGRLSGLPRMGAKQIEKLGKGIEEYRRAAGRFRIDAAEQEAARLVAYLTAFDGIDRVTPAGSLRRGRETVGDLDLLATGPACDPGKTAPAVEHVAAYPGVRDIIAKGENKISFHTREGLQVDVRLLPASSYGAALQYFTGSKAHNVALRQRALKMGYTLSEWSLARLEDESIIAAATEEEIYSALDLKWIPPEMRENLGEIECAARGELPALIRLADIRGDVHMHTTASDGRNSIREMAEAAIERGLGYIAITDHTKALAMANGLDEKRALEHIARIREVDREMEGRMRIFAGIEVDIMGDGSLDLDDEVLAQMDVVIASVHSRFEQPREEMTARILAAIENPNVDILGHPTGRLLLRREPYELDMGAVIRRAVEVGAALEMNAAAERLDLCDRDLRLAKELGAKIVISTDAHATSGVGRMEYGVSQLQRAWLSAADVLNTREAGEFVAGLRRKV